jgi:hypothetical protein
MGTRTAVFGRGFLVVAAVGLVLSISSSAFAVSWAWDNATGSTQRFGWHSGESDDYNLGLNEGLWGSPIEGNDKFDFAQVRPEFKAQGTPSLPDAIETTMNVSIDRSAATPAPGAPINEIHVMLYGTYTGDKTAFDNATSTLQIFSWENFMFTQTLGQIEYEFATFNTQNNTWEARIDVTDVSAIVGTQLNDEFQLSVQTHLLAEPIAGSASIDVTGGTVVLPEPASLALMVLGGAALFVRRARRPS